jgi:hypothetical protein
LFNSIPRLVALFVIVYQDLFVVGLAEKTGKRSDFTGDEPGTGKV